MNIALFLLAPLVVIALLLMPLVPVYRGITTGKRAKHRIVFNLCAFFGVSLVCMLLPIGSLVASAAGEPVAAVITTGAGLGYLAAALVTGLATIGNGIAVAAAAPAAIGAVSEDPKALGKALIFVAMGEGIALYGLLISILIINKL